MSYIYMIISLSNINTSLIFSYFKYKLSIIKRRACASINILVYLGLSSSLQGLLLQGLLLLLLGFVINIPLVISCLLQNNSLYVLLIEWMLRLNSLHILTMKKIINRACAVTILLYNWLLEINWTPGPLSSNLINTENAVPNNPENRAKIKYNVPISLALVELNHLSICIEISEFKILVWVPIFKLFAIWVYTVIFY